MMRRSAPMLLAARLALLTWLAAGPLGMAPGTAGTGKAGGTIPSRVPTTLSLDWAVYNPLSLIIRDKGWMEREFAMDGITVIWRRSADSAAAIRALDDKTLDFGSTSDTAALVGRVTGGAFRIVQVIARTEGTALLARSDSPLDSAAALKGRRVAVVRGGEAHAFLLRALEAAGLSARDVIVVPLQPAAGRRALEAGQVDAWVGSDPLRAESELAGAARPVSGRENVDSYGVLDVRDDFAEAHPDLVRRVLKVYAAARRWALDHPEAVAAELQAAAGLPESVAIRQLERTDLSALPPAAPLAATLLETGRILQEASLITSDIDLPGTVRGLLDARNLKP